MDFGQAAALSESIASQESQVVRQLHLGQIVAAVKRVVADGGYRVGNSNLLQGIAAGKSRVLDTCHRFRNGNAFYGFAAQERTLPDGGHAAQQFWFFQLFRMPEQIVHNRSRTILKGYLLKAAEAEGTIGIGVSRVCSRFFQGFGDMDFGQAAALSEGIASQISQIIRQDHRGQICAVIERIPCDGSHRIREVYGMKPFVSGESALTDGRDGVAVQGFGNVQGVSVALVAGDGGVVILIQGVGVDHNGLTAGAGIGAAAAGGAGAEPLGRRRRIILGRRTASGAFAHILAVFVVVMLIGGIGTVGAVDGVFVMPGLHLLDAHIVSHLEIGVGLLVPAGNCQRLI